jgi:hypothetical protein
MIMRDSPNFSGIEFTGKNNIPVIYISKPLPLDSRVGYMPSTNNITTTNWSGGSSFINGSSSNVNINHNIHNNNFVSNSIQNSLRQNFSNYTIKSGSELKDLKANIVNFNGIKTINKLGHSKATDDLITVLNVESGNCWGSNALRNTKVIILSNTDMTNNDLANLSYTLRAYNFNLDALYLENNKIGDHGVACLKNGIASVNYQTLYGNIKGVYQKHISNSKVIQNVKFLNLSNNQITDSGAKIISDSLQRGELKSLKQLNIHGNKITEKGWEYFAKAVKKMQAKTIIIQVATADTLKEMKEFLTKGFKYYTKTHKVVASKEVLDKLSGENVSDCDKTKDNVKKAFAVGVGIASLSTGNDYLIFMAGVEAGAGALISPDTIGCYKEISGDLQSWYNE